MKGVSNTNDSSSIINKLKITTMTINGKIDNIHFNEKDLDDNFRVQLEKMCINDKYILQISSNFLNPPLTSSYNHIEEEIIEDPELPPIIKKGRKKKDKNKYNIISRKIQGNGKSFNSQITFKMRCVVNPEKIYNIKIFRTGSYGIPGILNLENIKETLKYLINSMKKNINPLIKLVNLNINMNNYKTIFEKPENSIIKINHLINILNTEQYKHIIERPIKFDIFNSNLISIHFSNLQENSKGENISISNKKSYLVQLFLSGKICIKGKYDVELMHTHLKILEKLLLDETNNIIINKIINKDEIEDIIKCIPDDKIII